MGSLISREIRGSWHGREQRTALNKGEQAELITAKKHSPYLYFIYQKKRHKSVGEIFQPIALCAFLFLSDWEVLRHQKWTEAIRSNYILERAVTKDIGWVFGVIMILKMLLSLVTSQFFQSVEYLLDASLGPCINFETDERSFGPLPDLLDL